MLCEKLWFWQKMENFWKIFHLKGKKIPYVFLVRLLNIPGSDRLKQGATVI